MLNGVIQNVHDGELCRHEELGNKGVGYNGMRHRLPPLPLSAPVTRYPLGMARNNLNEELTVVSAKRCSSSKSRLDVLQLHLIYAKHAQFALNCEKFRKSVNHYKNGIMTQVLSTDHCCNSNGGQGHYFDNTNEGLVSLTISSNHSDCRREIRSLPNSSRLKKTTRNAVNNENLGTRGIGGSKNRSPMRTARSLGRLSSTKEFVSNFSYDYNTPRSIRLHNSNPSSFFEIESGDTTELAEESPVLYNDIQDTITSPHHPPFAPPTENNRRKILKPNVLFNHNDASLTRTDYFQDYMEERMARWRPGNSQFNVEDTMDGKHPYQQENFEQEMKAAKIKPYNPFISLKSWFNGKLAISDLENQTQSISPTIVNKRPNELNGTQVPEISQRLRAIEFKVNSSNSIIPKPFKPGECSNKTKVACNSSLQQEASPIEEPSYTPKALPFNDYDLNFETKDCFSSHKIEQGSNVIVDSMDEDLRDLLNGFDNFLFDCFRSSWNACS